MSIRFTDSWSDVIIDTDFASSDYKASEVLRSVIGQLSDGIWENSRRMEDYWRSLQVISQNDHICIKVYTRGIFFGMHNEDIAKWYANKIKQIVKICMKDDMCAGKWERTNTNRCCYLDYYSGVTVQDAYRVYDRLLGRIDRI